MKKSGNQLQWPLQGKNLIIFCLVLFFCISTITLMICLDRHRSTKERLLKEDRVTASLLSMVLDERLQQIVKTMESYANRRLLVQAARKKDLTSALKDLVSLTTRNPGIDSVVITDKEATVWAAYPPRDNLIGRNTAHREWYQELSKDWKPYITNAVVRIVAEKDLAVQIVVPILDESGEVLGVLVNSYRTIALGQLIQRLPTDPGCFNNVVDRKGNLIYSNRFSYDKVLTPYPFFSARQKIKKPNDESVPVADPFLNGRTRYISYAPLESSGWSVFIGRDSRAILLSEASFYIQVTTIALLLSLTILLALGFLRRKLLLQQLEAETRVTQELYQSEERFRATFEQAAVGIALVGIDGRWLRVNQRFCAIVKYPVEELLTKTFQEITHPDDLALDLANFRALLAGELPDYSMEKRYLSGDGAVAWVNLTVGLVRDEQGEPAYFISVIEDISKRKLMENDLQFHKMILEETSHLAKVGGWSFDVSTGKGFWTEEVARIHDLDPAIPTSREIGLQYYTRESKALIEAAIEKAVAQGIPYDLELEIVSAKGIHKLVRTIGHPVKENERVVSLHGSFQDITELKQAELKLEAAIADLQRSNKELEQFAYVASHDLQEPLRMVSSYTQLLAERYRDKLDDKANLFINYAVDGAVRMQLLINDLLAFSRIGTKGTSMEPVDVHAVLGEVITNLKISIAESKAIITNDDLPKLNADPSQLVQLFQNLIGNAIKYRGEQLPRINIAAKDEGQEWLFSISDNGIGIDPQFADKIFVIFQRLHTKEEYPGSGIGLAICKKIVERHRGRIWFESEPGKGTTFYFTIHK